MKKQILASLVLAALSASAFALPQVTVEQSTAPVVAEDGADRVGANRVAEGGAERTLERFRVAEDGADRVGANRVAEGGAERTLERFRVAEDGADRVGANRVAEGGADRVGASRIS
ncbi:phage infection protein [Ectopseudomonas khazarica]|uniref:phage infection protein n=1 Tax=Ectopseudomonas khazarica TaxID=2502979 RepID=UPI003B950F9E